jgi:uncharacterized protein (DUF1697 family)
VETFIASGNVIFDSPETNAQSVERRIERQLQTALGYAVTTFIRSPDELAAVAQHQPFAAEPAAGASSLYVAFLPAPPTDDARQRLLAFRTAIDDFDVHQREVYWLCRPKMSDSTFSGALLEKTIGLPATMRNITTIQKLAAKYPAAR